MAKKGRKRYLTDEEIEECRKLKEQKVTLQQIADKYFVSRATMEKYLAKKKVG